MRRQYEVSAYIYDKDDKEQVTTLTQDFHSEQEATDFYNKLVPVLPTAHIFITGFSASEEVLVASAPSERVVMS